MSRNWLSFYLPIIDCQKGTLRNQYHLQLHKNIRINLTKDVKDLYSKNYKTLKKETEEKTNDYKHIPCSLIGIIYSIKMSMLLKAIYRFNAIPINIPMVYFTDLEQIFQKFVLNPPQKTPNNYNNLEKKNKVGRTCYLISNYTARS